MWGDRGIGSRRWPGTHLKGRIDQHLYEAVILQRAGLSFFFFNAFYDGVISKTYYSYRFKVPAWAFDLGCSILFDETSIDK